MKNFLVKLLIYHESYNGYDLCDGYEEYRTRARDEKTAEAQVRKQWEKKKMPRHWIKSATVFDIKALKELEHEKETFNRGS